MTFSDLKPSEVNALIAEECEVPMFAILKDGYYYRPNGCGYTQSISQAGRYTKEDGEKELVSGENMRLIPHPACDYYGSLDHCAAMRATLTEEESIEYVERLDKATRASTLWPRWRETMQLLNASAPYHCEAFLRVKGKI